MGNKLVVNMAHIATLFVSYALLDQYLLIDAPLWARVVVYFTITFGGFILSAIQQDKEDKEKEKNHGQK